METPSIIEQVLNYLKDHEILLNDSRALANVELPASLHSLVLSRIDELVEQPRSTLRAASVFGRSFVGPDLGGAHPALGSEPHVEDNLAELEQKGFTELETPADPSYIFKHGVIQEVAYESLSFKLRRNLHSSIGDFLLKKHSESLEGQIDLLAHHYYRGENWSKALNFNLESARKAQREFANSAAIAAAANVLEAAEHLETETDTNAKILSAYEILGDVLSWQAQYLEAVETFETMAILAKDLGDEVAQAHAWQGMARVQMQQGDLRQAIASAEREESISVAANLKLEIVKARWVQAWGAFRLGEIERAAELANAMAELSVDLEDRSQHAENMNLQGVLQWASGDYDEAEQFFRDARSIYEETGDSLRAMPLSNNLGVIAESRGDYDSAADGYNEALSAARQIGNRDGEIVYLGNLGGVKVLQGDYVGAEADLRSVLEMSSSAGMDTLADTFSHLAEATLAQGDAEEALELSRQALDISVRVENPKTTLASYGEF